MNLLSSSAFRQWATIIVFCLSLTGNYLVWHQSSLAFHGKSMLLLNHKIDDFETALEEQLNRCFIVLQGVQGLFASSHSVERYEFDSFFSPFKNWRFSPGFSWVIYAERVPAESKDSYIKKMRQDASPDSAAFPDFKIRPDSEKAEYLPITYFYPSKAERASLGFDISSDLSRWQTVQQSVSTGQITASGLIFLRTDLDPENNIKGLLISAPIYKNGAAVSTPEERKAAWQGVSNILLNTDDLISGILKDLPSFSSEISIEIYDSTSPEKRELLYKRLLENTKVKNPSLTSTKPMEIGGKAWELRFHAPEGFGLTKLERVLPWLLLAASAFLTFLFSAFLFLLMKSYSQNLHLSEKISKELRGKKEHLNLALLASGIGIWEWDIRKDEVLWDENSRKMLGRDSSSRARFEDFIQTVHPRDKERVRKEIERCLELETEYETTFHILRPDGSIGIQAAKGKVYRDEKGRPIKMTGAAWDVTHQKKIEDAVHRSEINYRNMIESSADGILIVGQRDGRILFANRAAAKLFGQDAMNLLETQFGFPITSDKISEINLIPKNGKLRIVELHVAGTQWEEKSAYLIALRDVTARKELEAQFIQSQKMEAVGQLTGGIAHDFNNLLTVINGYSEMIALSLPEENPLKLHSEEILKAGLLAKSLTSRLLTFSRRHVFEPKIIDLNALILDLHTMARRLIGENIELEILTDNELGLVKADPSQMEQVLMNLIVNARDAMPKGGKITIETRNLQASEKEGASPVSPGDYAVLIVRDKGNGMSEEIKQRLFEPFFTTKPQGKGTGLGLAICETIVKQSGGTIRVLSELGQGTCFEIFLPHAKGKVRQLVSKKEAVVLPRGSETILLVEDEASIRQLASTILTQQGYKILEAENGEMALRIIQTHKDIRLAAVDLIMPRMGGLEFADHMSSLNPSLKILFITGYTDDQVLGQRIKITQANFLQKPFTASALIMKVREVLDR
jgi:signal transduction histidine kinase/CHASE1-domain containing sensor protein/CheY-like chemotaxis protein